jgi:hypothetical protein
MARVGRARAGLDRRRGRALGRPGRGRRSPLRVAERRRARTGLDRRRGRALGRPVRGRPSPPPSPAGARFLAVSPGGSVQFGIPGRSGRRDGLTRLRDLGPGGRWALRHARDRHQRLTDTLRSRLRPRVRARESGAPGRSTGGSGMSEESSAGTAAAMLRRGLGASGPRPVPRHPARAPPRPRAAPRPPRRPVPRHPARAPPRRPAAPRYGDGVNWPCVGMFRTAPTTTLFGVSLRPGLAASSSHVLRPNFSAMRVRVSPG